MAKITRLDVLTQRCSTCKLWTKYDGTTNIGVCSYHHPDDSHASQCCEFHQFDSKKLGYDSIEQHKRLLVEVLDWMTEDE